MTDSVDVLAVAAHPDDAEVGCGGVLALASDAGLRVGIVDLTAGERSTRGTPDVRADERERATAILGVAVRRSLGLPDTELDDREHRDVLIPVLRELRPAALLAPFVRDRHPDHEAAGRLTVRAAYLAGIAKVRPEAGPPHRPPRLYHYMIHHPFAPSFVVDVSRVWDRKMESLRAYTSQFTDVAQEAGTDLSDGAFIRAVDARATFLGGMIGAARGEAFWTEGPVALPFLPGLHDAGPATRAGYSMFP